MTANVTAMALQKILLVDDDKSMTFLTRITLESNEINCPMDECRNGREALDYLKRTEVAPEVILLDINMPVMDGIELLKELNQFENPAQLPNVFMLSSSDTDLEKCRNLGYPFVKGYFEKPLTEQHIQEMLAVV